jgi:hypothetical protein
VNPPAAARWPKVEGEGLYLQLIACAAWMADKSRRSREFSDTICGSIEGTVIKISDVIKRSRGGQSQSRRPRFFKDPNYLAAHIAACCVAEWRGRDWALASLGVRAVAAGRGRYRRVRCADGLTMRNVRDAAADYAVELVNKHYMPGNRRREAKVEAVMDLLMHARTKWPTGNHPVELER